MHCSEPSPVSRPHISHLPSLTFLFTEVRGTRDLAPEPRSIQLISAEELTSCSQSIAKWEMETVDKFILFSSFQKDCPEMQLCTGWFFKTEQPGTLGGNQLSYTCSSFSFSFPASPRCLSGLSFLLLGTVPPNKATATYPCLALLSKEPLSDSLRPYGPWPARLLCPWDSPGKSTGVGCHFFSSKESDLDKYQFSCSVVSDSLRPHEPQHARPPCLSPTPGVHPNSCPSSW